MKGGRIVDVEDLVSSYWSSIFLFNLLLFMDTHIRFFFSGEIFFLSLSFD